ncbi:MAG: hypothetical protein KGZ97_09970 [Bacteroidetes bacterium]|nr:hypothetical protein [Bacteroidota bacterium]
MGNKLKYKILASFLLLVSLLVIAGTVSIIEFIKLSKTVTAIIDDNYKTIEATKTMAESIERIDSGILLHILGEKEESIKIIQAADIMFIESFNVAKNNITEFNESIYIDNITENYNIFKSYWINNLYQHNFQGDLNWYHNQIHLSFINTKQAITNLMYINQNSLYNHSTQLKEKSQRAIMPGIVSIIGSIVFLVMLNFFITKHYITPITELSEAIKNFDKNDKYLHSNINSKDELKKLETDINNLITKLQYNKI